MGINLSLYGSQLSLGQVFRFLSRFLHQSFQLISHFIDLITQFPEFFYLNAGYALTELTLGNSAYGIFHGAECVLNGISYPVCFYSAVPKGKQEQQDFYRSSNPHPLMQALTGDSGIGNLLCNKGIQHVCDQPAHIANFIDDTLNFIHWPMYCHAVPNLECILLHGIHSPPGNHQLQMTSTLCLSGKLVEGVIDPMDIFHDAAFVKLDTPSSNGKQIFRQGRFQGRLQFGRLIHPADHRLIAGGIKNHNHQANHYRQHQKNSNDAY